ncbi:ferric reductase-like transmembrane domain-containing protein [Cellulomonas sp. SG140]|uniref:ferric reductase-like transmembrane domain-containing protein n=1 Tax=Cellulomonas sp. SG140 TaxID=2976536 RepID=UPI0021E7F624|nr:ferric reductase-like transmembrane domain-containing protein [Cellulomonas sp. SG140]
MNRPPEPGTALLRVATAALVVATAVSLVAVGRLVLDAAGGRTAHWVLGRAAGLTSYMLLLLLVSTGILLAHPWARHLRRPSARTRLALHASIATFTLAFTVLHVVVLATDPWAKVGWVGALLPMAARYRPVPVSLGVIAAWAGLVTGLTARFAGRVGRLWWPVHKVAAALLVLVWAHSVLAGSDVVALRGFYVGTGCAVVALAVTRYAARTPADEVGELARDLQRVPAPRPAGAPGDTSARRGGVLPEAGPRDEPARDTAPTRQIPVVGRGPWR